MSEKVSRSITLEEKDIEVVESKALNLSKFVRQKIQEEFPEEYE